MVSYGGLYWPIKDHERTHDSMCEPSGNQASFHRIFRGKTMEKPGAFRPHGPPLEDRTAPVDPLPGDGCAVTSGSGRGTAGRTVTDDGVQRGRSTWAAKG